jgi:hypothetical protein
MMKNAVFKLILSFVILILAFATWLIGALWVPDVSPLDYSLGIITCICAIAFKETLEELGDESKSINIGDKIYGVCLLDDNYIIEEITITEIGRRYIFCSGYVPPSNDICHQIAIEEIGVRYFLSPQEAEDCIKRLSWEAHK